MAGAGVVAGRPGSGQVDEDQGQAVTRPPEVDRE